MRTAASSLMSVKIFGYPIYMSVAVISLIFAMHGRKMIHVCFCDVLPGWEIQFGQIRRDQEYLLRFYMIVCLWDISLPLWMRSIVRNVFPGKVGGFWLLHKSFMIDSTIQSWRNCIWSKKLISINDLKGEENVLWVCLHISYEIRDQASLADGLGVEKISLKKWVRVLGKIANRGARGPQGVCCFW